MKMEALAVIVEGSFLDLEAHVPLSGLPGATNSEIANGVGKL
jgi:hypothetical protein